MAVAGSFPDLRRFRRGSAGSCREIGNSGDDPRGSGRDLGMSVVDMPFSGGVLEWVGSVVQHSVCHSEHSVFDS